MKLAHYRKVESARINVLPYLKQLGIIDEEGKTLERARVWRDDARYPEVCKAILKEVYPSELLDAVTDPNSNREQAGRWFANETGTGAVAARRMASLYALLVEGDPARAPDKEKKERAPRERTPKAPRPASRAAAPPARSADPLPSGGQSGNGVRGGKTEAPAIHINLQVHISSDATPEQIDQVFASMAKHIYPRG